MSCAQKTHSALLGGLKVARKRSQEANFILDKAFKKFFPRVMSTPQNYPSTSLLDTLLAPALVAWSSARNRRDCPAISDDAWLEIGVRRVMAQEGSGRGFLQALTDTTTHDISVSLFFESLKSRRRLALCHEINEALRIQVGKRPNMTDPFADLPGLNQYDLYAGDGHWLEHACHDRPIDGTTYATGHFFGLNMRSHALFHLTTADTITRKKEHDMHALKRLGGALLRQNAAKGRKVIWVWDRAGIDVWAWQQWKNTNGVYMISRAKENMNLSPIGHLEFDQEDPLNAGVKDFSLVNVSSQAVRCVTYHCPLAKTTYHFLTTLTDVQPGVIAALYKARWDIEKVFDETKQKLQEKKSWATTSVAKTMQATFICIAHNLLVLLEQRTITEHQLNNVREDRRRNQRIQQDIKKAKRRNAILSPLLLALAARCTQRCLQFIRWVRNSISRDMPWHSALPRLRRQYGLD